MLPPHWPTAERYLQLWDDEEYIEIVSSYICRPNNFSLLSHNMSSSLSLKESTKRLTLNAVLFINVFSLAEQQQQPEGLD